MDSATRLAVLLCTSNAISTKLKHIRHLNLSFFGIGFESMESAMASWCGCGYYGTSGRFAITA